MAIVYNKLTQQTWDAFVLKYGPRSGLFLQSWGWGEFQKLVGENVDRIAWMSETNEVNAIAQVIRKTIPHFGTYAYIPRGPITAPSPFEGEGGGRGVAFGEISIGDITQNDLFIRLEPASEHLTHALSFERRGVTRSIFELVSVINLTEAGFRYEGNLGGGSFEEFATGQTIGYVGDEPIVAEFDGVIVFPKVPELIALGKPVVYLAKRITSSYV